MLMRKGLPESSNNYSNFGGNTRLKKTGYYLDILDYEEITGYKFDSLFRFIIPNKEIQALTITVNCLCYMIKSTE